MHNTAVACSKPSNTVSDRLEQQREEVRYRVLRLIEKNPEISQRELAEELGISLGQINYQLKALKERGYIKMANFIRSDNRLSYIYLLTPKGLSEKLQITKIFLKRKQEEYNFLKIEIEKIEKEVREFEQRKEEK